jgi:hypothetical protein
MYVIVNVKRLKVKLIRCELTQDKQKMSAEILALAQEMRPNARHVLPWKASSPSTMEFYGIIILSLDESLFTSAPET